MSERVRHEATAGYVVVGVGGPMKLTMGYRGAGGPILTNGSLGTLFGDRALAERYIRSTRQYAAQKGFTRESWTQFHVVRIAPASVLEVSRVG